MWATTLDHAFCRLDVLSKLKVDKALHDERLEKFKCHQFWKTTLVQTQSWPYHDDGTTGIVNTLTEKVLTETSLLTLQHVGQRLEWAVTRASNWATTTTVVEQSIDCFLQHALFVVHDNFWSTQIEQATQAVVAVDDTTVKVVEV